MSPSVFDPDLSSTAIAETGLSELDGESGELRVLGFPVEELAANASYEEAAWLLFNERLPTSDELDTFTAELANARDFDANVRDLLRAGAEAGVSPMNVLQAGLAAGSLGFDDGDVLLATSRVVAVCPTIVAAYWRYRQGLDPLVPRADLGHAANFLYLLSSRKPDAASADALETYLVTIIEHGLNPSTFAARIVGSTGADPFSAATAAVGTLKGPRHGGMVERVYETLTELDDETDVDAFVAERLDTGSLPGFGHSVYETRDPRAAIVEAAAERVATDDRSASLLRRARELEPAVEAATENERQALHATVDYYAAPLLAALDVPPTLFPAVFAIGRAAGWMAHYLEQLESETLLRPRSRYVGPAARSWIPRDDRFVAGGASPPSSRALEDLASVLDTLAEPTRLELVVVLYESSTPLSYSTLRSRSAITDKGRFNYHLRKLRGTFVENTTDGYALTDFGRNAVETLLDEELRSHPLD